MEHQILKKHTTSGKNGYMLRMNTLLSTCDYHIIIPFLKNDGFRLRFIAARRLYPAAASRAHSLVVVRRVLTAGASLIQHGL